MTQKEFDTVVTMCANIAWNSHDVLRAKERICSLNFEAVRAEIDKDRPTDSVYRLMQGLARTVDPMLPAAHGFILLVFPFGEGGRVNYVSNAERPDCINALKEFLIRNGSAEDWMKHV